MAVKQGAFPYDIDNLLGGAVRILFADLEEASPPAIPDSIDDVVAMSYPYAPKTGWLDLGATKESFTYSRGFETEGWEIQQEQGNVIEEVTSISRTSPAVSPETGWTSTAMASPRGEKRICVM